MNEKQASLSGLFSQERPVISKLAFGERFVDRRAPNTSKGLEAATNDPPCTFLDPGLFVIADLIEGCDDLCRDNCMSNDLKSGSLESFTNGLHLFLMTKIRPGKVTSRAQYPVSFTNESGHVTVAMTGFDIVHDIE